MSFSFFSISFTSLLPGFFVELMSTGAPNSQKTWRIRSASSARFSFALCYFFSIERSECNVLHGSFCFAPCIKYGSKIFLSNRLFPTFFTRCLRIAFVQTSSFLFTSEHEKIFSPSWSKFAVECDWNTKNSQNAPNLGFFGNLMGFFRKKTLKFFKIATCGKFCLECVSDGIFSSKFLLF